MATDQQVALTRSNRMPAQSSHISKAARQVVPAFLQKLYEMVNDPNNAELIRWSDAGDSFFVLDHERFAHEVLGRWFKHRNFSSFVRQLNMYGFHKIPHLQQGVLKSDTDTEFWNFAHANFHRGQPDLLCLIQRKKQVAQPGDENSIDLRDGGANVGLLSGPTTDATTGTGNAPLGNPTLSSGQILDIHSIVNGISAIKRHQTTISAELNELKRSNQLLWQDALAARAKHQKQQDTINRIVKFLAGVFGSNAGGAGSGVSVGAGGGPPGGPGGPHGQDSDIDGGLGMGPGTRRKMRLMIEDAKRDGPRKSMIEELSEIPLDTDSTMYDYPIIETPISVTSPAPSIAASDNATVHESSSYFNKTEPVSSKTDKGPNPEPTQLPQDQISRSVTPSRHSPTSFEFDPRISGVLNSLSPIQIQQLLVSLAAQTISEPSSTNGGTVNPNATITGASLTPYHQPSPFDFPSSQTNPMSYNSTMSMPVVTPEGLISFDHYDSGAPSGEGDLNHLIPEEQQQQHRMQRHWNATEDIDNDVDDLNSSIHSLIQSYGLDQSLLDESLHSGMDQGQTQDATHGQSSTSGAATSSMDTADNTSSGGPSEMDFEAFFNNLSSSSGGTGLALDTSSFGGGPIGNMDYSSGDIASPAFLDEVQTPTASSDMTASPVQPLRQVSPELHLGDMANDDNSTGANLFSDAVGTKSSTTGRKRKSDLVTDFDGASAGAGSEIAAKAAATSGISFTKSKRRKDK